MEMLQTLAPLTTLSTSALAVFFGVLTRISALVFFLPGIGERFVPTQARLAAALSIALIVTPIVLAQNVTAPQTTAGLTALLAAEAVAGAILGFSIRIAIYILQTAGSIAAQAMSLSQLFGGLETTPEPPIGTILVVTGMTIAVILGLHFEAVRALAVSFIIMPFGVFPGGVETGGWAAERAAFSFAAALALALPFVLLGFIYNLAIGAVNRAMPQLMVALIGAPAVSLAGMVLLALSAPVLLGTWSALLDQIMQNLIGGAL